MERFLLLFDSYRRRVADLDLKQMESAESIHRLQGEVHELRSQVDNLREERDKAQDRERIAYQMLVNVDYQVKYGFIPFPGSPHLPSNKGNTDNGGPVEADYVNGSALRQEILAQNRDKMKGWMGKNT